MNYSEYKRHGSRYLRQGTSERRRPAVLFREKQRLTATRYREFFADVCSAARSLTPVEKRVVGMVPSLGFGYGKDQAFDQRRK